MRRPKNVLNFTLVLCKKYKFKLSKMESDSVSSEEKKDIYEENPYIQRSLGKEKDKTVFVLKMAVLLH